MLRPLAHALVLVLATLTLALPPPAFAADERPPADGSQLDLPKGADVAIVVFEDLQCPDCKAAHPQLLEAAKANGVPLVIRDFPIARHAWAFPAAILARWFTLQNAQLGLDFRAYVFQNQDDVTTGRLRAYADEFARAHGITLPEDVDPDGQLQRLVQDDFDLARLIGLSYVPLIFVIGHGDGPDSFVEVTDPAKLGEAIAQMRKRAPKR